MSTGRSGSGLCPTQNQPDGIGFWENSPAVDRRSKQVGQIRLQRVLGWVGRRQRSEKTARKLREKVRKTQIQRKSHRNLWDFIRSDFNLTKFDEISIDSVKISLDLHEIVPEFGFFITEIWVFIAGIWNFLSRIWVIARLWVFRRPVRVFGFLGERNRNWLIADRRSRSGQPVSDRFRSGLQVGRVTEYVWTALLVSLKWGGV